MIPKRIHYCWLSGDKYPSLVKRCIHSWKKVMPEYEFILWDLDRFDLEENIWVKDAVESKKFAFAADYIRLYAIYNYGGIYLDSDVEVLKTFNNLLHLPYFIGSEGDGIIEAGVFGAEAKCEWIGDCLDYYKGRNFINKDGSLNTLTLPNIMMSQISHKRKIYESSFQSLASLKKDYKKDLLIVFGQDYFCAKHHGTGVIEVTNNTYSIHHFAASWLPKKKRLLLNIKIKLMHLLGVHTVNALIQFFGLKK